MYEYVQHQDDDYEQTQDSEYMDNTHIGLETQDTDWMNKSAEELSKHVSLEAPKTEFATDREKLEKSTDKMTRHWIERIDDMDPNLSQDMTSEYLNVQKTAAQIKRLEAKVEMESHGFEHIDEYNTDKMLLDNMKKQMDTDSKANPQDVPVSMPEAQVMDQLSAALGA